RQAVRLLVGEAGADQPPRPVAIRRLAIFDDKGLYRALLDHVGKVILVHIDHAAARVTMLQIAPQQNILLFSGPGLAGGNLQIGIAPQRPALAGARLKLARDNPYRDAGSAV